MDPQVKLMFEAFDKKFTEQNTKWDARISALERSVAAASGVPTAEIQAAVASQMADMEVATRERIDQVEAAVTTSVAALESAAAAFDSWRPFVEHAVHSIQIAVEDIKLSVNHQQKTRGREAHDINTIKPSLLGAHGSASVHTTDGRPADGPDGHRVDHDFRDQSGGMVYTYTPDPVKGGGFGVPQEAWLLPT